MLYERDFSKSTQDLLQTSSGRSLKWTQSQNFPNMDYASSVGKKMPDVLLGRQFLPSDHYNTTSNTYHNYKGNSIQENGYPMSKPLPHYKMHYNKDLHEKLLNEKSRRPLSMANQKSETLAEFNAKSGIFLPDTFGSEGCKGFSLKEHYASLPSNEALTRSFSCGSKSNKLEALQGNKKHLSVFLLNDPYMTTNVKHHRTFQEVEKLIETKFDTPMVKRQEVPMRDRMTFKSTTTIRTTPAFISNVPNSSFKTDYTENYIQPSSLHRSATSVCLPSYRLQTRLPQQPPWPPEPLKQPPNPPIPLQPHQQQVRLQRWDREDRCSDRDKRQFIDSVNHSDPYHTNAGLSSFPIPTFYSTEAQTVGSKKRVLV